MALHDELLTLARFLVDRDPDAQIEAELRRAVSTAYYALFHLLVHEATIRVVAIPALRPRVARSFDRNVIKSVCQEYANLISNADGQYVTTAGQLVPEQLRDIASAFVPLQDARHQADYNTGATITHAQADLEVMRAEAAFLDWEATRGDPAADTFLAELLCRGMRKR
jgi:hypothetical protein